LGDEVSTVSFDDGGNYLYDLFRHRGRIIQTPRPGCK
jgi:hypothetical protein